VWECVYREKERACVAVLLVYRDTSVFFKMVHEIPPLHNLRLATVGASGGTDNGDSSDDDDDAYVGRRRKDRRDPAVVRPDAPSAPETVPLKPAPAKVAKVVYKERSRFFLFRPFTIAFDYPCVSALACPGMRIHSSAAAPRHAKSHCLHAHTPPPFPRVHRSVLRVLARWLADRQGDGLSNKTKSTDAATVSTFGRSTCRTPPRRTDCCRKGCEKSCRCPLRRSSRSCPNLMCSDSR
jgi:hypothetical protein